MASFQCYRPAQETCETECHENSFGHKVPEMAGMVFQGHHQGQYLNNQGHSYGQTPGHHHSDYALRNSQTQCFGQTAQTQLPYTTQSTHGVSKSSHGHHGLCHSQSHSHGHHLGQINSSHGLAYHGKNEKKMKNKCDYKKREKSHCNNNKRRDGNRSCSDSSGSDSD